MPVDALNAVDQPLFQIVNGCLPNTMDQSKHNNFYVFVFSIFFSAGRDVPIRPDAHPLGIAL